MYINYGVPWITVSTMDEYMSEDFSSSSDEEDDIIEEPEIWCQRQLDYWKIEHVTDNHKPPPVIEYILHITSFHIREATVLPIATDPNKVMDPISANNWHAFWQNGRENTDANFSFQDFDIICEYCLMLCEAVHGNVSHIRLRSCILHLLGHGKFI